MRKPTTGPWVTENGIIKSLSDPRAKRIDIADIQNGFSEFRDGETIANANLLAAAPELLAALELAATYIEDGAPNTALERIKAAVKKAKGE